MMESFLDRRVRDAAKGRCEYRKMPEHASRLRHVLDHVIATQHGGLTVFENLALACGRCNQFKGPNIAGLDPYTAQLTALFHPRRDNWDDHFTWYEAILNGLTPVGRTTVTVLNINAQIRVANRKALMEEGVFPL